MKKEWWNPGVIGWATQKVDQLNTNIAYASYRAVPIFGIYAELEEVGLLEPLATVAETAAEAVDFLKDVAGVVSGIAGVVTGAAFALGLIPALTPFMAPVVGFAGPISATAAKVVFVTAGITSWLWNEVGTMRSIQAKRGHASPKQAVDAFKKRNISLVDMLAVAVAAKENAARCLLNTEKAAAQMSAFLPSLATKFRSASVVTKVAETIKILQGFGGFLNDVRGFIGDIISLIEKVKQYGSAALDIGKRAIGKGIEVGKKALAFGKDKLNSFFSWVTKTGTSVAKGISKLDEDSKGFREPSKNKWLPGFLRKGVDFADRITTTLAYGSYKTAAKQSGQWEGLARLGILDECADFVEMLGHGLDLGKAVIGLVGGVAGLIAGGSFVVGVLMLNPAAAAVSVMAGDVAATVGLLGMPVAAASASVWATAGSMRAALAQSGKGSVAESVQDYKRSIGSWTDFVLSLFTASSKISTLLKTEAQIRQAMASTAITLHLLKYATVGERLFEGAKLFFKVAQYGQKIAKFIGDLKKLVEKAKNFGKAALNVGKQALDFGIGIAKKAGKAILTGGKWLLNAGKEKVHEYGEILSTAAKGAINKGRSLMKKFRNFLIKDDMSETFDAGDDQGARTYADGALTGPFYPKGHAGGPADPELLLGKTGAYTLYVNGVRTPIKAHIEAARGLANTLSRPVIGIWNATGMGKGLLGGVHDFVQYFKDRFEKGGEHRNKATERLVHIIRTYGDAKKPNGGLNIFAHSQGSAIVSHAISIVKGQGVDISRLDVTLMGNAISQVPIGAKYHIYGFDNDLIARALGSQSGSPDKLKSGYVSTASLATILHHPGGGISGHDVWNEDQPGGGHSYIAKIGAFQNKENFQRLGLYKKETPEELRARSNKAIAGALIKSVLKTSRSVVNKGFRIADRIYSSDRNPIRSNLWNHLAKPALSTTGNWLNRMGVGLNQWWDRGLKSQDLIQYSRIPRVASQEELEPVGGSGSLLPSGERMRFSSALGLDLDGVRVHTGPEAARAARQLGARAFARGRDVYFGAGQYDPHSQQGRALLAHELTHVVQQSGALGGLERFASAQGMAEMEAEADRTAGALHVASRTNSRIQSVSVEIIADRKETEEAYSARIHELAAMIQREAPQFIGRTNFISRAELVLDVSFDPGLSEAENLESWKQTLLSALHQRTDSVQSLHPRGHATQPSLWDWFRRKKEKGGAKQLPAKSPMAPVNPSLGVTKKDGSNSEDSCPIPGVKRRCAFSGDKNVHWGNATMADGITAYLMSSGSSQGYIAKGTPQEMRIYWCDGKNGVGGGFFWQKKYNGSYDEFGLEQQAREKKKTLPGPPPLEPPSGFDLAKTITPTFLKKVFPTLSLQKRESYAPLLLSAMQEYGITSQDRATMFLAQVGHESGGLNWFKEFASGANYENRKDLGNTQPGDGKKFKGRGAIQITGRSNYSQVSKAFGVDFLTSPELLEKPEYAMRASAWWWSNHGLNEVVDKSPGDVARTTKIINGGKNGLEDRISRFRTVQQALSDEPSAAPVEDSVPASKKKSKKATAAGATH